MDPRISIGSNNSIEQDLMNPGYDVTVGLMKDSVTTNGSAEGNGTSSGARDANLAKIEIAISAVIFVLALVGNGIVLIVLLGIRNKRKLSRMNLMIVHLSCADLFVALFNVLPQLVWDVTHLWLAGDFMCRFIKLFQLVAMFASSYVLVTTAIDRFLAICYPLTSHYWTKTRMTFLVGVAWGLSVLFSLPQVFIFKLAEVAPSQYNCWAHFDPLSTIPYYVTYITLTIYIIPFFCLAGAYGCICYVVWKSMKFKEKSASFVQGGSRMENGSLLVSNHHYASNSRTQNGQTGRPVRSRGGLSQAKMKTVKLTLTVIICYLLCWGPFFVAQMWAAWDPTANYQATAMVIITLLASLNSCTNPWIYLCFSDNLHRQLLRCFCVRTRTRRSASRASTSYDYDTRMRSTTLSQTEFTKMETSFR